MPSKQNVISLEDARFRIIKSMLEEFPDLKEKVREYLRRD